MESVTSTDGTRIAYETGGTGPPLVLVHGTTSDHTSWDPVLPALRERFTVYAMDRRGRGDSGDAETYTIRREFEDLAAVCGAIDGPVDVLGHSYGALCAIGAAPLIADLRRLVLYEPPLWTEGRGPVDPAILDRMEAQLESEDHEAVLETFFRDVAHDVERFERYRDAPDWPNRVATAPTVPRENRATGEFRPDPDDYADLTVPTYVLLGAETAGPMRESTAAARDLLPGAERVVLDGAGHAAMYSTPDRFVATVVDVLGHAA